MFQGQHTTAWFPDSGRVEVIILEVRGDEALVQEVGTQRAEWVPANRIG